MKTIVAFITIFGASLTLWAQQDPMFTHYMYNTLAVNPAYAGTRDALTLTALHRSQWTGFTGAPRTQTFTMHTPLVFENTGIGLSVLNDKIGPEHTTSAYADFSYKIKVTQKSFLSFGLKGGINVKNIDLANLRLDDQDDLAFASNIQSKTLPNFGFGLYYFTSNYYVGLSVPKLLENDFKTNTINGSTDLTSEYRHYFLIAGCLVKLSEDFDIKPSILMKVTKGAPIEGDLTAMFIFKDKIQMGLMYRTGDAWGVLAGMNITEQLTFGYSYDWSFTNKTSVYNGGSHELMLRYDFIFNPKKKIRSPRYF